MRFQSTDDTDQVEIQGVKYKVDAEGYIECDNTEHQPLLRQLGFRGEADPAPVVAPVQAETPPEIPEGYVSEEAVRALVEENEDMKVAIDKLNKDAAASRQVGDELRNRIQELEGQLEAAKTPSGATETATETQQTASGGESSSQTADTSGDTSGAATTGKKGK